MSKTPKDWPEIYLESLEEMKPVAAHSPVATKLPPIDFSKLIYREDFLDIPAIIAQIADRQLALDSIDKPAPKEIPKDYYNSGQLWQMGIKCGDDCMVHKTCILVNPEKLTLGTNVRIDAYCTISAGMGIRIGSNVHVAGYVSLFGGSLIDIGDYASIASGSKVFSVSDDVMGRGLVGPCVPNELRYLHAGMTVVQKHAVMAINSTLMPGAILPLGSTLLPNSVLLPLNTDPYSVLGGSPAKLLKYKLPQFKAMVEDTLKEANE
jgi:galactoside O-acetyltransferase